VVTFECPWCTEPVEIEPTTALDVACDTCGIAVEVAPDPAPRPIKRAA